MNETAKLKSCPFCGGEASCNNRGLNDKNGNPVWWAECLSCGASIEGTENTKGAAIAAWNKRAQDTEAKRRRAEENPKPLTLDELREMEGEPVYNADNKTWYVVEDIDEIDELSTVISMTDTTEFDSEEGLPKFYRTKTEGCGE